MELVNFDLRQAINDLGANAAFRIANEARPAADYLFARFLPERPSFDYTATSGSMTVRATMANLVGMDSPYPEGGAIDMSTFREATAKLAQRLRLPERNLRSLQNMLVHSQATGQPTNEAVQRIALNFLEKLIVQPHLDAAEHLRGLALVTGALDITNNSIRLQVNYAIPAGNFGVARTGTDSYGGTTSKFWDDVRFHRRVNKTLRFLVMHPDTLDLARYNTANSIETVSIIGGRVTLRRLVGTNLAPSQDVGDTVEIIVYGKEGEILDATAPGTTRKVPFMPRGAMLGIGEGAGEQNLFEGVMAGGTQNPDSDLALGYTHIAPTVEAGGTPGRWSEIYVPEDAPWTVEGRGASNIMPVIENVTRVTVTTTAMS